MPSRRFHVWVLVMILTMTSGVSCRYDEETDDNNEPKTEDIGVADSDVEADTGDMSGDGELILETLSAPVKATYDSAGVLHLDCKTNRDCFVAQGYFHASDRFVQMDLIRNQTRGRLSEMLGFAAGEPEDVYWRQIMSTRSGEPLAEAYLEQASAETREIFDAYSEGVNGWIGHLKAGTHGAMLPEEYTLIPLLYTAEEIRPWDPVDSVSQLLQLSFQFSGINESMRSAYAASILDSDVWWDIYNGRQLIDSSTIPVSQANQLRPWAPFARPDFKFAASYAEVLKAASVRADSFSSVIYGPVVPGHGSNNWVVDSSRTATGTTLMANDPHLSMNHPSIWYMMEMDSKTNGDGDLHVAGASIPTGPGIVVGHNENVAWGVTVAVFDLSDAYLETLSDDGNAVIRNGERVDIIRKTVELKGKGEAENRSVTLEFIPDRGPIMAKDEESKSVVTVKWVGHEPGNDLDFIPALLRAKDVEEAGAAISPLRAINQNWVIADTSGSIGWFPKAAVPDRRSFQSTHVPWGPLPGDGTAEWDGFLTAEELPELINPPAGFIATSNNDMTGQWADGDPTNDGLPVLQPNIPTGVAYRHSRISAALGASTDHTLESMKEIQYDIVSVHGQQIVPVILADAALMTDLSPAAQEVVSALSEWNDFECPSGLNATGLLPIDDMLIAKESTGCLAFHALIPHLSDVVMSDELIEAYGPGVAKLAWNAMQSALAHALVAPGVMRHGERFFDDVTTVDVVETRQDSIRVALEQTGAWLATEIGDSRGTWIWGAVHQGYLGSLLGFSTFDSDPFWNDGGFQTVQMSDPNGGLDLGNLAGASLRMVVELGQDRVESEFQLPGGNVHLQDSPFFNNLLDKWQRKESTSMHFGEDLSGDNAMTIDLMPPN